MQLFVDLQNDAAGGLSIAPASTNANTNGSGVDLQNADVRTHIEIQTGTITGSGLFSYQAQESDDNTTFANVADANGAIAGQNTANTRNWFSFLRSKRYVRVVATLVSGTSAVISAAILSQKKYAGAGAGATSGVDKAPST